MLSRVCIVLCFFFQAEDGIRDLVRSRGLGDVYKRQQLRAGIEAVRRTEGARLGYDPLHLTRTAPGEARDLSLIHI